MRMSNSDPQTALDRFAQFVHRLIDGRDPDLAEHHARSSDISIKLCQRIGCTPSEIKLIAIASAMHDLGKMSINEHILNKPARLTKTEFELIKQHSVIGGHLLEPLGLDVKVTRVVVHHHENFDGSGYPEALRGEDIPYLARIMRITDSYDALTADRPYHKGVSSQDAVTILLKDSRFYDPYLLESFCQLMQTGR
jgi:putative two-component system response regulator